jgi:hypothetical protein
MTTARTVPVTIELDGDELDAEDAWHVARKVGLTRLLVDSFARFRYGGGFTNSRALALQALAVVGSSPTCSRPRRRTPLRLVPPNPWPGRSSRRRGWTCGGRPA